MAAGLPALAADHVIDQKGKTFSERTLTIKAGDFVIFKNSDDVTHNVYSASPNMKLDIGRQAPGHPVRVPFKNPGVVEIRCAIHPRMRLTITVKK